MPNLVQPQNYLFILFISIALSGCSGTSKRVTKALEPEAGDSARLRGVGVETSFYVDQNVCGNHPELPLGIFVTKEVLTGMMFGSYLNRSLDMPAGADLSGKYWGEMHIQAGQPIQIRATYSRSRYGYVSCSVPVYFKPVKGRDYEAELIILNKICLLKLTDITGGGKLPVIVSKEKPECN